MGRPGVWEFLKFWEFCEFVEFGELGVERGLKADLGFGNFVNLGVF